MEPLLGHRVEDLVLLADVAAEQVGVAAGGCDRRLARSCVGPGARLPGLPGHHGDVGPAGVVVHEHDGDGTAVAGEAGRDHGLEEDVLLLAVVARVGELADEAHEAAELGLVLLAPGQLRDEGIEGVEGAEDELVLFHELSDGVHSGYVYPE